ncbi:hypothetical protein BHE74_00010813 [Ensete ventricosum]|nr:hypothetical protein BHE74_00010813 [Ensete ventricosum]
MVSKSSLFFFLHFNHREPTLGELYNHVQASNRLSKDEVGEIVDERLGGQYPHKSVAKVTFEISYCSCVLEACMFSTELLLSLFPVLLCLVYFAEIAASCLQYEADDRPNMSIVVEALDTLLIMQ